MGSYMQWLWWGALACQSNNGALTSQLTIFTWCDAICRLVVQDVMS